MVRYLRASSLLLAGLVLAGCSAQPPAQTPVPTPTQTTAATPSPTPSAVPLASAEAMKTAVNDGDPAPTASFFSTVDATPAFFENLSATAVGSWSTRISCSSATGADIAISIQLPEGGDQQFSAPCGTGLTIMTVEGPSFTSATGYRITATGVEPAAVAVGLVPR